MATEMEVRNYIKRERRGGRFYISCWVPLELKERLDRIVKKEGVPRAAGIRAALQAFLDAYEEEERRTAESASCSLPPRKQRYGA